MVTAFPMALFVFAGRALTVGIGGALTLETALAFLLALAALPAAAHAASAIFGRGGIGSFDGALGKSLFALLSFGTAVVALYVAVMTVKGFSDFVSEAMFLRMPAFLVQAVFLGFCAYLSSCGFGTLRKFALLAMILIVAVIGILFLVSLPELKWEMIGDAFVFDSAVSPIGVARELGGIFAPMAVAIIYLAAATLGKERGVSARSAAWAVVFSSVLLLVCYLNVALLLGLPFGSTQEYPYSSAVSTVTVGKLFARMEGFAYMMYFAAVAVRTSVCVSLFCLLFKGVLPARLSERRAFGFMPSAVAAALLFVLTVTSFSPAS